MIPRVARQRLYDWRLGRERIDQGEDVLDIALDDFTLETEGLEDALDVVAFCREPKSDR